MRKKDSLYAGTAKTDITPETGIVHDRLHIRTLVLDVDGNRIAFIAVDLGSYFNQELLGVAKERFGIDHVLTSGSHTHSSYIDRNPDSPAGERLLETAIAGLKEAVENKFSARIAAGSQRFPQISYNRLIPREDGRNRGMWVGDDHHLPLNPDRIPYGPVEREVGVIKIEDLDGNARAILMNFPCHSDVVAKNFEVSADFPGVACRKVEETFKDAVCLFVQGGAGNIAPLYISPRRKDANDLFKADYTQIEKMGTILANATLKLARSPGRWKR